MARGGDRAAVSATDPVCRLHRAASLRAGGAADRSAGSASLHRAGGGGRGGGQSAGVGAGQDPRGAHRPAAALGCRRGCRLARRPAPGPGGAGVHRSQGWSAEPGRFRQVRLPAGCPGRQRGDGQAAKDQRPAPPPDGLRFYDLRHTWASLLIAQGERRPAEAGQPPPKHPQPTRPFPGGNRGRGGGGGRGGGRGGGTQEGPGANPLGETAGGGPGWGGGAEGFEPSRELPPLHAFQACAFDRSAKPPPGSLASLRHPRGHQTLAARMGFEPMDALRHQRFSRPPHSSTLAPCRPGV